MFVRCFERKVNERHTGNAGSGGHGNTGDVGRGHSDLEDCGC